jgi:hypothetical protein
MPAHYTDLHIDDVYKEIRALGYGIGGQFGYRLTLTKPGDKRLSDGVPRQVLVGGVKGPEYSIIMRTSPNARVAARRFVGIVEGEPLVAMEEPGATVVQGYTEEAVQKLVAEAAAEAAERAVANILAAQAATKKRPARSRKKQNANSGADSEGS